MKQCPVVVGLLLCEKVVVEQNTRNISLINCFNWRAVRRIPSEPLSFVVFASLMDGLGEVPITVRIQRLDNLDDIYQYSLTGAFSHPLNAYRLRVPVRGLSFPVVGDYEVLLLLGGDVTAQTKLRIIHKVKP